MGVKMQSGAVQALLQHLHHLHHLHHLRHLRHRHQRQGTQGHAMTGTSPHSLEVLVDMFVMRIAIVLIATRNLDACPKASVLECATPLTMRNGVVLHPHHHHHLRRLHHHHLPQNGQPQATSCSAMGKMLFCMESVLLAQSISAAALA